MTTPDIAIVGAGPAGLIAAEIAASAGATVIVFERMPSVARKFLMAGRGGLNLTHSEPADRFLQRYADASVFLKPALDDFPPPALRAWAEGLGQKTFVGSSGRVFPESFKASPLLRAWLHRLDELGVQIVPRHEWLGWDDSGALRFYTREGERSCHPRASILAMGGASWPRLGSDGGWRDILSARAIGIKELRPANCGFLTAWSDVFRDRFEGEPLKNVALSFGAITTRGEILVTSHGLEGGGIYALSAVLRDAIAQNGQADLSLDLRPDLSPAELAKRLLAPRGKSSFSNFVRKAAGLPPVALGLLQEIAIREGMTASALPAQTLAGLLKALPIRLSGSAPLNRAISTAGGIARDEIDASFMLRKLPGVFVAGEMIDWEAPTGGYLLQACFATGVAAAKGALGFIGKSPFERYDYGGHAQNG